MMLLRQSPPREKPLTSVRSSVAWKIDRRFFRARLFVLTITTDDRRGSSIIPIDILDFNLARTLPFTSSGASPKNSRVSLYGSERWSFDEDLSDRRMRHGVSR